MTQSTRWLAISSIAAMLGAVMLAVYCVSARIEMMSVERSAMALRVVSALALSLSVAWGLKDGWLETFFTRFEKALGILGLALSGIGLVVMISMLLMAFFLGWNNAPAWIWSAVGLGLVGFVLGAMLLVCFSDALGEG